MQTFDWLVFVNAAGCASGGLLPIVISRRGEPGAAVHGFAAGTLLGASLLVLTPEAAHALGAHVGYAVLAGFLLLYLLDRVLLGEEEHHGHEHTEAGHSHHVGALALAGFGMHTIADGAALGMTKTAPQLGYPVLAGILFHEVPAQYVFARLLVASGASRRSIVTFIGVLVLLMAGSAYGMSALAGSVAPSVVPWGLGISAGMFLFISTAELLPRVHRDAASRGRAPIAFIGGVLCAVAAHEIGHEAS